MPLSVLIAPDKFKGTLTAKQAANAIASGWEAARPKDRLTQLPISDGGDGFGPLMADVLGGEQSTFRTKNAAGEEIESKYWATDERTLLFESASIIGLAILDPEKRRPFNNDSTGLGIALQLTLVDFSRHCIIGIGGSATTDGGFGFAHQLGWKFLDGDNQEIKSWPELTQLASVNPPAIEFSIPTTVAVDVQNPLLGPNGCTRVYGPQKGLREEDIPKAEAALTRLAEIWESQTGEDAAGLPGAGAAGGLGFGLHCFAGAEIRSGFEIYAETAGLEELLKEADVVVTGEGSMDRQTVMGKGVGELAKMARENDCRCIGLAGKVEDHPALTEHMNNCHALTDLTSLAEAKKDADQWLEKLARDTAQTLKSPT